MGIDLANSPCSWGVDYADHPDNPRWSLVFDEIAGAGFEHAELGPVGFVPLSGTALNAAFEERGLTCVAGFIFEPLHEPAAETAVLERVTRTLDALVAVGANRLVTIDHLDESRTATAGNPDTAPRLDASRFAHMIGLIDRIADMALEVGITPVIHQHAGTFIEFEDELVAVLDRLDAERVGLCIDTGHMSYAGIDPIDFFSDHADRARYFHFKDVDPVVHERVVAEGIPFLEAIRQNVFTPVGRGVVDWTGLAEVVHADGYDGAATIEQDVDPTQPVDPRCSAVESLTFLRSTGF